MRSGATSGPQQQQEGGSREEFLLLPARRVTEPDLDAWIMIVDGYHLYSVQRLGRHEGEGVTGKKAREAV